jgi:hypothetical protein
VLGNLAVMFFFGLFASFDFDSLSFLLGALASSFLFLLTPAFLFDSQSIFCREMRGLDFSTAALLCSSQAHHFSFQTTNLRGGTCGGLFF